ncbi:LOW QUALITY PROTEIN: nuclear receptor-binding factor 2b [Alosa sapidissima]|uniref:LOW QUALITY PROTEIN: nuclear receptor-binding factor 2b n=1 Tax=Alosa sapidissima TaxID=34773 RepID=UPI001C090D4D|nr:LOW QUALITY PROTEIN: nuclear receptor-binding factor 2b [Alosa sapidissima]
MEVVESPLNLAHQQCRKADRLLATGKYEDAIVCHRKAADLLKDAMKLTDCEQARLSLELQRDSHIKQQRLIEEKWKRSRREAKPRVLQPAASSDGQRLKQQQQGTHLSASQTPLPPLSPALDPTQVPEHEYDTWLYLLKNKGAPRPAPETCPATGGSKALKDDKMRLEEQETTIGKLRELVDTLMSENERLKRDNGELRTDNERLRRRERERELERDDSQSEADADFVERSELLWVLPQRHAASASLAGGGGEERKAKDIDIPQLPPLEMPTQEIPLDQLPALELSDDVQHQLQEILDGEKL